VSASAESDGKRLSADAHELSVPAHDPALALNEPLDVDQAAGNAASKSSSLGVEGLLQCGHRKWGPWAGCTQCGALTGMREPVLLKPGIADKLNAAEETGDALNPKRGLDNPVEKSVDDTSWTAAQSIDSSIKVVAGASGTSPGTSDEPVRAQKRIGASPQSADGAWVTGDGNPQDNSSTPKTAWPRSEGNDTLHGFSVRPSTSTSNVGSTKGSVGSDSEVSADRASTTDQPIRASAIATNWTHWFGDSWTQLPCWGGPHKRKLLLVAVPCAAFVAVAFAAVVISNDSGVPGESSSMRLAAKSAGVATPPSAASTPASGAQRGATAPAEPEHPTTVVLAPPPSTRPRNSPSQNPAVAAKHPAQHSDAAETPIASAKPPETAAPVPSPPAPPPPQVASQEATAPRPSVSEVCRRYVLTKERCISSECGQPGRFDDPLCVRQRAEDKMFSDKEQR
jgi:hypothetical protein